MHNITVVGRHVPEPCKNFIDFQVDEDIINNLEKSGYSEPTPIQKQAVPLMLKVSYTLNILYMLIIFKNVCLI